MISASSFSVVSPVVITDAMLVSSTIAETDHTAWSSGTAYTVGTRVRYVAANVHSVYECVEANTARDPTAAANAQYWALVGPTNRWGMFDLQTSSVSTAAGSVDVELTPGLIDAVALDGLVGSSVRIRMTDGPHGTFYDKTFSLLERDVYDYTTFFFAPFRQRRTLYVPGLPLVSGATLRITLSGGGSVSLGTLAVGRSSLIGQVRVDAELSLLDYSRQETDAFGRTLFVRRLSARQMRLSIHASSRRIDEVVDILDERRSQVSFWAVGAESGYRSLQILGWHEFGATVHGPEHSTINCTVKGIT